MKVTTKDVHYYDPLTHYQALDIVRLCLTGLCLVALIFIAVVARQRWVESRRSASYYLAAIAVGLIESGYANILGLGHPYSWTLPFRIAFVVMTLFASVQVLGEYARPGGLWDKGN